AIILPGRTLRHRHDRCADLCSARRDRGDREVKKIALCLMLPLAALAIVASCTMPGQNTAARPAPGDNQVKVEVEAVQITQNAVTTVTEHINVLVNAVNGNGEPLIADDFKPLTNWDSGETPTIPGRPWAMEFSQ